MTELYLAYGSNLNKRQMRMRCPTATPLGKVTLTGAKLVFRVYADLDLIAGAEVPCGLWRINRADEKALDKYEGEGTKRGYYKEKILIRYAGREREALLYMMTKGEGIAPPTQEYAQVIRDGYQDFKLENKYLNAALRHSWEAKEHTDITVSRRKRALHKSSRGIIQMPESVRLRRQLIASQ